MSKKVSFIAVLVFIIISISFSVKASTDDTIRIAGDENYPPYEFVGKNGTYKGFNVDIMKAISIDIGKDIEIIPMPWKDALKALENKEVDAIQGMFRSISREEQFSFSQSLLTNSQAIFVKKETGHISELNDLSGLKVGIQAEDISEELLKNIPETDIIIYSNQEQAIGALLGGKVDAFVGNRLTGLYILQSTRQYDKVKIVGEPVYPTEYASATLKENKEVLELLNKGLEDIKRNGQYDKIYHKWFGETLTDNSVVMRKVAVILSIVFILVLVVIIFIFYWNRSLKRLVNVKTRELATANGELYIQREMLQQSNRLKWKIIENILDGIIVFTKGGEIITANSSARRFLRIDNIIGQKLEDINFSNEFLMEGYDQALEGRVWNRCFEWKRDSGEVRNIDCSIYPIKDGEGKIESAVIVIHDYTEINLLNEAKEYDKFKTEFFANLSHELRTPLSIIHAAAQLLELNGNRDNPEDLKAIIKKSVLSFRQNINRLTRLINNIIDITKADTGFLKLQKSNCNIVSIVEEITMSVVDLIESKGISIEFDTDIEEKIIACDIDKIERIILNLLSNSVKFSNSGGSIFVRITDDEDFVTISVKDTGIGIPADKKEIIFERFRQVDKSISRNSEGSGIGLSLVKSLVELHGGSVRVESTYGAGSEFIIQLPVEKLADSTLEHEIESFSLNKSEVEFSDIYL